MNTIGTSATHPGIRRYEIEKKVTYDIKHSVRMYIHDCYYHAITKDRPLNMLLRFEFDRKGTMDDVREIRAIAHKIRCYHQYHGIELLMVWSRGCKLGLNKEECCILVNVPSKMMVDFIETAKQWRSGLLVEAMGHGEDFCINGDKHRIIDWMTRNMDSETKSKDWGAVREQSDAMYGYRLWASWNLMYKNRHTISQGQP